MLGKRSRSDDGDSLVQAKRQACCASVSAARPDQPLTLTVANLEKFQSSLQMDSQRRSRSPEKAKYDTKDKLQLFNIFFEEAADIPAPLQQLISDLKQKRVDPSPNAKLIARKAPLARARGEQDGIDLIKDDLLIRPAIEGGAELIERAAKLNLNRSFLPQPSSVYVAAQGIRLETPHPDLCFGYLPSKKAKPGRLNAPFTMVEEETINKYVSWFFYRCSTNFLMQLLFDP
jgi:hypothetical protein